MLFLGKYPLKDWKVISKNSKDKATGEFLEYSVGLWEDATLDCDCMWASMNKRQPCRHKIERTMLLEEEFGSLEKAVEFYKQEKQNAKK